MKHKTKKRPHKRRRSRRTKTKQFIRGGEKNQVYNDSEGIVEVYPEENYVKKTYTKGLPDYFFNKEIHGFELFYQVDPDFFYHPRIFEIERNSKDQGVIFMEYVGHTINTNMAAYTMPYASFLIKVLNLRNQNGDYLLHGDGHTNNVCIKDNKLKYIDLGSVMFVFENEIVTNDFIKKLTDILSIFVFLDPTLENTLTQTLGQPYSLLIHHCTNFLQNFMQNIQLYTRKIQTIPQVSRDKKEIKEISRPTKSASRVSIKDKDEANSFFRSTSLFPDD